MPLQGREERLGNCVMGRGDLASPQSKLGLDYLPGRRVVWEEGSTLCPSCRGHGHRPVERQGQGHRGIWHSFFRCSESCLRDETCRESCFLAETFKAGSL